MKRRFLLDIFPLLFEDNLKEGFYVQVHLATPASVFLADRASKSKG
jgi:hypothetical protein